jgi:Xaa-Pro aminopeptidase
MMRPMLVRFQEALRQRGLDGAVIAAPESLPSTNMRYLSGFTGSSAYLVVAQDQAWILTDSRYLQQASLEAPDCEVRPQGHIVESIARICRKHGILTLGWEDDKVPVRLFREWADAIPVVWRRLDHLIEELRLIKTSQEIDAIRRAAQIAGESLLEVVTHLVGRREIDVALDLEMAMRRRGAESLAFATIVASGERGSLPHAHPTERVIGPRELVTIDFGAQVEGYKSDETVTVATGPLPSDLRHLWAVVEQGQQQAIAAIRPGASSRDLDTAARDVIRQAGYGDAFGHGTGHGVGLDIHEEPFASQNPLQERVLDVGMTITVEPGIYLAGVGGVRLEDTFVVTPQGSERLTIVPKQLEFID